MFLNVRIFFQLKSRESSQNNKYGLSKNFHPPSPPRVLQKLDFPAAPKADKELLKLRKRADQPHSFLGGGEVGRARLSLLANAAGADPFKPFFVDS
jgi:hypothetical protein